LVNLPKLKGEGVLNKAEATKQISPEVEAEVSQAAEIRARAGRWDLDVAVFLFTVLIVIIILLFQEVNLEVVAPIAIFGLAMVWLIGWRRGKQLYRRFYAEELVRLEQESRESVEGVINEVSGTIEDIVKKALRERWQDGST
jgi:hypothetical protein